MVHVIAAGQPSARAPTSYLTKSFLARCVNNIYRLQRLHISSTCYNVSTTNVYKTAGMNQSIVAMWLAAEVHQVQKLWANPTAECFRVLHGSVEPYFILIWSVYIVAVWSEVKSFGFQLSGWSLTNKERLCLPYSLCLWVWAPHAEILCDAHNPPWNFTLAEWGQSTATWTTSFLWSSTNDHKRHDGNCHH